MILARGKRICDGKWIYFFKRDFLFDPIDFDIKVRVPKGILLNYEEDFIEQVDRETVRLNDGQTDRNGCAVFIDDILVRSEEKERTPIVFNKENFYNGVHGAKSMIEIRKKIREEYEVIGNIFDNPELLNSENMRCDRP